MLLCNRQIGTRSDVCFRCRITQHCQTIIAHFRHLELPISLCSENCSAVTALRRCTASLRIQAATSGAEKTTMKKYGMLRKKIWQELPTYVSPSVSVKHDPSFTFTICPSWEKESTQDTFQSKNIRSHSLAKASRSKFTWFANMKMKILIELHDLSAISSRDGFQTRLH